MRRYYNKFSRKTSAFLGSHIAFVLISLSLLSWFISGFFLHFSHLWESILVLGGEAITLILLSLLQYKEITDIKAMNTKLDELLRSIENARINLVNIEDEPDEVIEKVSNELKSEKKKKRK